MDGFISASCKCGSVKFISTDIPVIQVCCHCSDCREATGDPYSEIAFFKARKVEINGSLAFQEYNSSPGNKTKREYCPGCRDIMFDRSSAFPGLVGVFTNKIEPPFIPSIRTHVWVKSKLSSVSIPSGVTEYQEGIL